MRLYSLGQGRMLPGRERLRRVLERAGDPHLAVPSVLVGGTNGKGRLVATLSAVLSQHFITGAFLKPHLKSIRERWRIGDQDCTQEQFIAAANAACDLIEAAGEPISFFEANVLLGSLLFRDAGCEVAVWEVGLGGKEDACNLLDPLISVITNVQRDHQAILGDTLGLIATDKAHIARPGRPLLLGPPREGWESDYEVYAPVVREIAESIGARFVAVDAHDYRPLFALPDDTNALLQATLGELVHAGLAVNAGDVLAGLRQVRYRGRMEYGVLDGAPVLMDAAHNPDSMRWLGRELSSHNRRFTLIFGCQNTKDAAEMLREVADYVEVLVPIEVPVLHPLPAGEVVRAGRELGLTVLEGKPLMTPSSSFDNAESAEAIKGFPTATDFPLDHRTELDPPDNSTGWIDAVRAGLALSRENNRPAVICGSIYYLGEILRVFEDGWLEQ